MAVGIAMDGSLAVGDHFVLEEEFLYVQIILPPPHPIPMKLMRTGGEDGSMYGFHSASL
jgi:hypothetical protein